jgi:hypothetical protein
MFGNGPHLSICYILGLNRDLKSIPTSGPLTKKYCGVDALQPLRNKSEIAIEIISNLMSEFFLRVLDVRKILQIRLLMISRLSISKRKRISTRHLVRVPSCLVVFYLNKYWALFVFGLFLKTLLWSLYSILA